MKLLKPLKPFKPSIYTLKNLFEIDDMLLSMTPWIKIKDPSTHIPFNLRNLSFVSPIGAISLLILLNKLSRSVSVDIIPPNGNDGVIAYLERINFFRCCSQEVRHCFENSYDIGLLETRNRADRHNNLMEITKIANYDDVDLLYKHVNDILKIHHLDNKELSRITNIVTELGTNILDHSKSFGYAAIQYYPWGKVSIGVADDGIGIIKSMRNNSNQGLSDLDIIKLAFNNGVSSLKDEDRGFGLSNVRQVSFSGTNHTTLSLRTHKGLYDIGPKDVIVNNRNFYYPGTFYQLEIIF